MSLTDDSPRVSEMLTVEEAAEISRVSASQLYKAVRGPIGKDVPQLPAVCIGRRKLIRRATLESWLREIENASMAK